MRIPNEVHRARPWRIHELMGHHRLEDAWALPAHGGAEDFRALVEYMRSIDPSNADSRATRFLWRVRDRLGAWFDLGRIERPGELFAPLYETGDEYASEISNRTVHAVMHLGWVDRGAGRYQGEMAVYVKPRGLFGQAYMAAIRPFRHLIVYPALMRQLERDWAARGPAAAARPDRPSTRSGS